MIEHTRRIARGGAVVAPIVVAAVLSLLREFLANTSAALVLVLVVVAVGAAGDRVAGLLAAVVAAASFDFFLTQPYYQFVIFDRDDIETAVLLVAVGVAVTEIVQWGRRQQARAGRREGYLAGVANAARMAADDSSADDLIATVGRMITDVLDLDDCRFDTTTCGRPDRPRIDREGAVRWRGREVDVEREGLPTMNTIELPAGGDGCYLLTATSRTRRPDRERRLVAVTLAEQVGARHRPPTPSTSR